MRAAKKNIQFHRNPRTPEIETCEVTRSRHHFPNHYHDDIYSFCMMVDGGSSWNGKTSEESLLPPGKIAVMPPCLVHSGKPIDDNSTYKMIYIKHHMLTETVSDILEKDDDVPDLKQIVLCLPELLPLFRRLYNAVNQNSSPLEVDSALTTFIAVLINEYGTNAQLPFSHSVSSFPLHRAAEFLTTDFEKKISLEDAANEAGLSKYHFLRSFKKHTGISPHNYRMQKRIEAAKKLMLQGVPLAGIAVETGFSDQSHFTNQFKNYTGITPNQYLFG